jgi:Leucine-rich repeat (LRR) protein
VEEYGRLETLEVAYNKLVGPLPEAMFRPTITALQRLDVGANNLTGGLPTSLSFATHLKTLMLFDNMLTGEIPNVLGQLELENFQAQGNNFVGPLPLDSNNVFWASSLEQFWVQNNQLSGTFPVEISNFIRLEELRLSSNKIQGTIPESLYDVSSLVRVHLDQNALFGTISPRLNLLASLEIFDVSSNALSGTMVDVTNLEYLKTIRIQFNQLSGPIPASICSLLSLQVLEVDCLPEFTCQCCTLCCNQLNKTCGVRL